MDQTPRMQCEHAEAVMQFLNKIGLTVNIDCGANGFTKHIRIEKGQLIVDPGAPASEILHEAGHLAIVPERFRHYLSADLADGMEAIFSELVQMDEDHDSPLSRAMMQAGDTEATAWAWAAGKAVGLPEEVIIQDHEYDGDGASIRLGLSLGYYLGIHGLSRVGFCAVRPMKPTLYPVYPELSFWLHP